MQQSELSRVHARMVAWIISVPAIKENGPNYTEEAEDPERGSPGHITKDPHHQERGERPSPSGAHPHDPLRSNSLITRQPARKSLGEIWKTTSFTCAKKSSRHNQRGQI